MTKIELEEIGKEHLEESLMKEKKDENMTETEDLITKRSGIEDGEYSNIYEVKIPVSFYFNNDGTYDGLAFYTEDITEDEAKILEELLDKLEEDL